jgi:hypothetical protein
MNAHGIVNCVGSNASQCSRAFDEVAELAKRDSTLEARTPMMIAGCSCQSDGRGNKVCVGDNARECLRRRELADAHYATSWAALEKRCACKLLPDDRVICRNTDGSSCPNPYFPPPLGHELESRAELDLEARVLGCHTPEVPKCRRALGLEERTVHIAGCNCKSDGGGNTVCVGGNARECLSSWSTTAAAKRDLALRSCWKPELPECRSALADLEKRLISSCICTMNGTGDTTCDGGQTPGKCVARRTLITAEERVKRRAALELHPAGGCICTMNGTGDTTCDGGRTPGKCVAARSEKEKAAVLNMLLPAKKCGCRGDGLGNWVCIGDNAYECIMAIP